MSKYLLLGDFNKYFNRIIKKFNTKEEYIAHSSNYYLNDSLDTNFMTGNHIEFDHIFNFSQNWEPDYLLILDNNLNIVSRWFILEWDSTRKNQNLAKLRRDAISDKYDLVINAPIYLEKGYVDLTNPLCFNPENMNFNQIKKDEILLKDNTRMPWIIAYVAKNAGNKNGSIDIEYSSDSYDISINTPIANSIYASGSYNGQFQSAKFYFNHGTYKDIVMFQERLSYDGAQTINKEIVIGNPGNLRNPIFDCNAMHKSRNQVRQELIEVYNTTTVFNDSKTCLANDINLTQLTSINENNLWNANEKIIKDSLGKFYRVSISRTLIDTGKHYSNNTTTLYAYMKAQADSLDLTLLEPSTYNYNNQTFQYEASYFSYTVVLNELTNLSENWSLNLDSKQKTLDAEYDILAFPYRSGVQFYIDSNNSVYINEEYQLEFAQEVVKTYSDSIYDLQLLPYCPIRDLLPSNSEATLFELVNFNLKTYTTTSNNAAIVFHASYANFTFNIYNQFSSLEFLEKGSNLEEWTELAKIDTETKIYRLCSPNYSGMFEFNLAKNMGLNKFNVDCTYKPYSPYIHVNPDFKNLYGKDWDDARGLICGGDFSLSITKDAFRDYELRNKNYQIIFDRQIQNIDLSQKLEKTEAIFGGAMGIVQGGLSGATQGALIGGGYGAAAGAVVGTAASSAGMGLDLLHLDIRQSEVKDYSKDMYSYNLGNIKALPYSLSKVSAYNYNNKIFPFVEVYGATDTEEEMLLDKIKYNGMTINAIMTLAPYISENNKRYFKGQLIRLEGDLENQLIQVIYAELLKGVFL